ncbi:MAG: hypothetical protein WD557_14145 [Dehalococcoidia bacterium]
MRAFAASLFVVLLLVAGCSDQDEPNRATPTATDVARNPGDFAQPPSAYLKDAAGNAVEGGTGTFCWRVADVAQCRDYSGPRTNVDPLELEAGSIVEFVFDAGTPREVSLDWTPAGEMTSSGQGATLDWGPKDAANYRGPSYIDAATAPTERGLYVLAVFTLFPEGDVSYGFYVEVT